MDFFFPKNQLKSLRCKCSVNYYSANQVYGDNISITYSWVYWSGINIARKLAVLFSVFKILPLNFVLENSTRFFKDSFLRNSFIERKDYKIHSFPSKMTVFFYKERFEVICIYEFFIKIWTLCDSGKMIFGHGICKNYVAINRNINMCAVISESIVYSILTMSVPL